MAAATIQIVVLAALAGFCAALIVPMQGVAAPFPFDQCNKTVGCLGLPPGCEAAQTCQDLATYSRAASGNNAVHVDVYSTRVSDASSGDKYISVGFNNIGRMPLSAIVNCVNYMDKTANMDMLSFYTSYALLHVKPFNVNISAVQSLQASNNNGLLKCSFDVTSPFRVGISKYDLSQPTYMIIAGGTADETQVKYHGQYKRVSDGYELHHRKL